MGCCGGPQQAPDFDSDNEGLSQDDLCRFGGDDIACKSCGESFYADAPMCPRCGHVPLEDAAPAKGSMTVPVVTALMIVLLVVLGIGIL